MMHGSTNIKFWVRFPRYNVNTQPQKVLQSRHYRNALCLLQHAKWRCNVSLYS